MCSESRIESIRGIGIGCMIFSIIQIIIAINWAVTIVGYYTSMWIGIVMFIVPTMFFFPASKRRYIIAMVMW